MPIQTEMMKRCLLMAPKCCIITGTPQGVSSKATKTLIKLNFDCKYFATADQTLFLHAFQVFLFFFFSSSFHPYKYYTKVFNLRSMQEMFPSSEVAF